MDVGPLVRPSDRDHLDHMPQVYMIALCSIEHQSIAPCCFVLHSMCFLHTYAKTRVLKTEGVLRDSEQCEISQYIGRALLHTLLLCNST